MPDIRILPEHVANRIAAGEVVERPASVVKELVENSLDAQASGIVIDVRMAGRGMIRVSDDGVGMSPDDVLLSLERHATSKVQSENDLDAISTLGFRGEALPSIAAVSKLELISRTQDRLAGTKLLADAGTIKDVREVGASEGTQVSVRRLFYCTPARAKFLKSDATELSHILDVVQRHALVQPAVGFRLTHNGRELLNYSRSCPVEDRISLTWGDEFLQNLLPLVLEDSGLAVGGFVGNPHLTRSGRSHQFFFLNRRPIFSPFLSHALEEAFRGTLTVNRHPVAVIFLDADPRAVDVNVHPAKREIRFADGRLVRKTLTAAVRDALARISDVRSPVVHRVIEPEGAETGHDRAAVEHDRARPEPVHVTPGPAFSEPAREPGGEVPEEFQPLSEPVYSLLPSTFMFVKQLFNTYLLCTDEDRLLIIDQHALHERIIYEELSKEGGVKNLPRQELLVPLTLDFSPQEAAILEDNLELFERAGISVEPFGGTTFKVSSICHLFEDRDVARILRDMLEVMLSEITSGHSAAPMERLAVVAACRAAVKAGDPLSDKEIERLLEGMKRLPSPCTCLHGRPIVVQLSQDELENTFRRRG